LEKFLKEKKHEKGKKKIQISFCTKKAKTIKKKEREKL